MGIKDEKFVILFDHIMEDFLYKNLRDLSYKTAAYAQKTVKSYDIEDDKSLSQIHSEVSIYLDNLEENLFNISKPKLKK